MEKENEEVDNVTENRLFFLTVEGQEKLKLLAGYSFCNCSSGYSFLLAGRMKSFFFIYMCLEAFYIALWVKDGTCH